MNAGLHSASRSCPARTKGLHGHLWLNIHKDPDTYFLPDHITSIIEVR